MTIMNRKKHPLYNTWYLMKKRCLNPKAHNFQWYGGRGITVCEEWKNNFQKFISDMGPRPEGYTLDRIDSDGSYCPENCRWASQKTQNYNRRCNRVLTYQGRTMCMAEWAEEIGIKPDALKMRLNRGWTIERALTI